MKLVLTICKTENLLSVCGGNLLIEKKNQAVSFMHVENENDYI